MRIGILGSACNPPHKGHIRIAELAKVSLGLDKIILIPSKSPPHKDVSEVSSHLRFQMAKLAVGNKKDWVVSDLELERPGMSYTKDTIQDLKRIYPKDQLFWIIGADSFLDMPRDWNGGYKNLDLCKFVVVPRRGYPFKDIPLRIVKKVIVLKHKPLDDLSSTKIRNLVFQRKSIEKFVGKDVAKFIRKHKLYS